MRVQDDRDRRAADRRGMKPALDAAAGTIELDLGHAYSTAICARLCDASGLNDQADFPCNSTFPTLHAVLARIIGAYPPRAFVARLTLGAARRLKMTCGNWAQGTRADAGAVKSWQSRRIF
jgi:hypothetical protein